MRIVRFAIGAFAIVVGLVCGPNQSLAAGSSQAVAALNQAVSAFNRGDMKAWAATCDSPVVIIDDFPPHVWRGPTACADWARSFSAMNTQQGIKPGSVSLGAAWHSAVDGNRAYFVYPATFSYRHNGKAMSEAGIFTFVLNRTGSGWRIAGWSWADRH